MIAAILLVSCGEDTSKSLNRSGDDGSSNEMKRPTAEEFQAVATTYTELVEAKYVDASDSTAAMAATIEDFIAAPSDVTLEAAKQAWLEARAVYGPTEAFRFYDGPIDDPATGLEGQINAWPLDEAYIDYVDGNPESGIINDVTTFPVISDEVLIAANEQGGEQNISTGWHAIEFLLWGQDRSEDAPGARPFTDYTTAVHADRRATYLQVVTDQLVRDLSSVRDAWAPGAPYREAFLQDPKEAVRKIFRGIGALAAGELAGERMATPFETKDQEDEHSCFSDNTNEDVRYNLEGIKLVYLTMSEDISGPSLSDLVATFNPEVDEQVQTAIEDAEGAVDAFPTTFDRMITAPSGDAANTALEEALVRVEDLAEALTEAGSALGLQIATEV